MKKPLAHVPVTALAVSECAECPLLSDVHCKHPEAPPEYASGEFGTMPGIVNKRPVKCPLNEGIFMVFGS